MADFARYLNIRSATTPVLSSDGRRVAFLTDITGNFQVWSAGADGASTPRWPQQLTFFVDKVWELYGTPAADHLLAVGDVGGNERQQFYLIRIGGEDRDGRLTHEVIRLTDDDSAIHNFGAWSNNGQNIMFASNARNHVDFDIYRLDIPRREIHLVRECTGRRNVVAWSSDDRYVLSVDEVATEQIDLYLLDLDTGEERALTTGLAYARYDSVRWQGSQIYLLSDRTCDRGALCRLNPMSGSLVELANAMAFDPYVGSHRGELELLALAPQGQVGAVVVNAEGYSHLFLLDLPPDGDVQIAPVPALPAGVIGHIQFSPDGKRLVFDLQTVQAPSDIWRLDVQDKTLRRLTYSDLAGIRRPHLCGAGSDPLSDF